MRESAEPNKPYQKIPQKQTLPLDFDAGQVYFFAFFRTIVNQMGPLFCEGRDHLCYSETINIAPSPGIYSGSQSHILVINCGCS